MLIPAFQCIAMMKLLMDNTDAKSEELFASESSATLSDLAAFIARMQDPSTYRTKIKFCALCESASDRAEGLALRKDFAAHDILDVIIEWIQEPSSVSTLHDG
jgi:hypothetical protein